MEDGTVTFPVASVLITQEREKEREREREREMEMSRDEKTRSKTLIGGTRIR